MDNVFGWGSVCVKVGGTSEGVVVERQHTYGIVHDIGGVARHADDLAEQVGDSGVD